MKRKRPSSIDLLICIALGFGTATIGLQIFVAPDVVLKGIYIIFAIISAIALFLHLRRVSGSN